MLKRKLAVAATVVLTVVGCIGDEYAAEVGYKAGSDTKWEIWGNFSSLDQCRDAAIARYRTYEQQGRAVSWACLNSVRFN
jgi:hypothetical protein